MALGAVRLCVLLTVAQGAAAKTVEDLRADLKTRGQRLKEATFRQGGVDSLSQSQSQLKRNCCTSWCYWLPQFLSQLLDCGRSFDQLFRKTCLAGFTSLKKLVCSAPALFQVDPREMDNSASEPWGPDRLTFIPLLIFAQQQRLQCVFSIRIVVTVSLLPSRLLTWCQYVPVWFCCSGTHPVHRPVLLLSFASRSPDTPSSSQLRAGERRWVWEKVCF